MGGDIAESPRKRLKTDNVSTEDAVPPSAPTNESDAQSLREAEVGITQFVSADNEGFSGIFKKRYTDFLVNEILPTGEVLHLRTVATPSAKKPEQSEPAAEPQTEGQSGETKEEAKEPEFQLADEDNVLLESYFGDKAPKIIALHKRALSAPKSKPSDFGRIPTTAVTDRDQRTKMHQAIRRIFSSQLESATDPDGIMVISVAANRNKRGGQSQGGQGRQRGTNWDELGGPFLHFTIHKENKDTMETIGFLARQMKMNAKTFQFAGTKDRRGVTVQRASGNRVHADRLAKLNSSLRGASLGDFEYRPHGLELGDLNGNEFVITLRECEIPGVDTKDSDTALAKTKELVGLALRNLRQRGYFNYYGLQRFGTFATRTDTVGVKMLQGDFKSACDAILHFSPHVLAAAQAGEEPAVLVSSDDRARAEAIHLFQSGDRAAEALDKMPRKFNAETCLIRHLSRSKNDYFGALHTIPRNLRLMYIHAYQSRVWNFAAGERWRLYGDKVVEGDLVIVHEHRDKEIKTSDPKPEAAETGVDADGELIVLPKEDDRVAVADDIFTRARALTADEAASGKYTIFDIVLPLPGFDVLYPANEMTDFYKRFMGSEQGGGLDPFDMRRKWRDLSLSGSYRKLLSRMGEDYSFEVKAYSNEDEQFVRTDLDAVSGRQIDETARDGHGDKLAVILKFQLGQSQYATMALRELMKGNAKSYTPEFGGR